MFIVHATLKWIDIQPQNFTKAQNRSMNQVISYQVITVIESKVTGNIGNEKIWARLFKTNDDVS